MQTVKTRIIAIIYLLLFICNIASICVYNCKGLSFSIDSIADSKEQEKEKEKDRSNSLLEEDTEDDLSTSHFSAFVFSLFPSLEEVKLSYSFLFFNSLLEVNSPPPKF